MKNRQNQLEQEEQKQQQQKHQRENQELKNNIKNNMENKNNLNNEEYNPYDFNITERKFVNIKKILKTKAKEKGFDLRKKIEEPVITPRTKK